MSNFVNLVQFLPVINQLSGDEERSREINAHLYQNYKLSISIDALSLTVFINYRVDFTRAAAAIEMLRGFYEQKSFAIYYSAAPSIDHIFLERYGKTISALDLRAQRLTLDDERLGELIDHCPNLSLLRIESTRITAAALKGIGSLLSLQQLNLYGCSQLRGRGIVLPPNLLHLVAVDSSSYTHAPWPAIL